MKASLRFAVVSCAVVLTLSIFAEDTAQAQIETIIVTARRREETNLNTPVAIVAFSSKDLERYAFTDLNQLATQVPSLVVQPMFGSTGGSISLRGISTGTGSGDFDQSVSLNIDGVVQSRIVTMQQGYFDVKQIEILKGPQALFFGKNSPGGIISFQTADPGDSFEAMVRASYDFDLNEETFEGIVSGPISDNWGARLAVQIQHEDGAITNVSPGASLGHLEKLRNYFVRGTLKGAITDRLDFRAKLAYANTWTSGIFSTLQSFFCPTAPAAGDDCLPNHRMVLPDADPAAAALNPWNRNGRPQQMIQSIFGTVEMNYDLDDLKLTNVVGWNSWQSWWVASDPNSISPLAPFFIVGSPNMYRSITEELRLASDFKGPFQFMVGGLYQNVFNKTASDITIPFLSTFESGTGIIHTNAYSFFAQVSYDILPELNFSGGARYTDEEKSADGFHQSLFSPTVVALYRGLQLRASNLSPEATLRWKPEDNLTFYGSYKEGFKSGGFNETTTAPQAFDFKPERIAGYEVGAKGQFLDQQLNIDLAAFSYIYSNMQVTSFDPNTSTLETLNAASAKTEGVEADLIWAPDQIKGLQFNAGFSLFHARFRDYVAQCYVGQSIGQGCNLNLVGGAFTSQDVAGGQLINAPDHSANLGVTYEGNINDAWRYDFGASAGYKDHYNPSDTLDPNAVQSASWVIDASARVSTTDHHWELAVIGKNLTDVFRATISADVTGSGFGTGTAVSGPGNLYGIYGEPRSIAIQVTYRY